MTGKHTLLGLAVVLLGAGQAARADTTISLTDAVRQGKVKVEVKSRGGYAGPFVRVEVQRLVAEDLRIEVEPGTVLLNGKKAEQNLAVGKLEGEFISDKKYRPGRVMVLVDGRNHAFLLEAFCLDYTKKAPGKGGGLQLAAQDKRVARILNPPPELKPSPAAVQIAIWMDRAGISAEQARKRYRRPSTEVDVRVANRLLVHAEKAGVATIPKDMSAEVRVEVSRLFSHDPGVRVRAASTLGQMGAAARAAVPFIAENLLDRSTDRPLPASVARIDVDVAVETAVAALERLDLPGLGPLIEALGGKPSESAAGDATSGRASDAALRDIAGDVQGIVGRVFADRVIGRLKSSSARVRERSARLLGATKNRKAVEPLIEALADENARVRQAAAEALTALTDQDFGTDATKWRTWRKENR